MNATRWAAAIVLSAAILAGGMVTAALLWPSSGGDTPEPKQELAVAFRKLDRALSDAESRFKTSYFAPAASPADRREAVQKLKEERAIVSRAIFDEITSTAASRKDQPIEDVLAEMYWSVTPPINPLTGEPDFGAMEEERQRILKEAGPLLKERGLTLEYITGEGEGSYRKKRFSDPQVQAAVEQYEKDVALIRDSGYWDAIDKATRIKSDGMFQTFEEMISSFRMYIREKLDTDPDTRNLTREEKEAIASALERKIAQPIYDLAGDARRAFRADPAQRAVVDALIRQGYYSPGEEFVGQYVGADVDTLIRQLYYSEDDEGLGEPGEAD
ncbi:MAG: hypothetical protein Kow0010_10960 [Dehalococcoidia bacterium]